MSAISATNRCPNCIYFPWKTEKSLCKKIAAWAAFFFIGWIYHPVNALYHVYKRLTSTGKVQSITRKTLLQNPISAALAAFNNSHLNGVVNGVYITTNESNLEATRKLLKSHALPNNKSIHIGCATWHNLDIICERKSTYGLIIDFNPKNAEFIEKTIDLIHASETREIFKEKMILYLNSLEGEEKSLFFHWDQQGTPTDRLEKELLREGSWLNSDEDYLFIKQLVSKGNLVAITEQITNFNQFSGIRNFLDSNDITVDTLYLSNICNFMRSDSDRSAYIKSVKKIINEHTLFIHCPNLKNVNRNQLRQQSVLGSEILAASYDTSRLFEENSLQ